MTTVPQLRPFCCTDFSADKKSENLSFLFGLSFTSKKKKSINSNNYKDIGNLHLCRCTSSSHNSTNFSASSSSSNWDWNRWCRHFSEIEQAESFSSVLKFQLEDAIEKEDFQEAAKLKMAIAEATSKDSVAQIMSEMQNAIDEERYHDASRLCKHAGSGLVGWWVGYSTESDDPFGRLVRVTPGVGRFVGRSYSPRQLITASPGTPLFEIFVVKDEDEKYVMQVVSLHRAKAIATNSTGSSSESGKNLSSSDIEEASAMSDQNDNKEERSGQKGLNIEGSTEERIKSVINFLKDKIPSLNIKLVNANATMEVLEDNEILKQLMQDDEKVASSENSEDEYDELEDNQFNEVSLSGGADPVEDGEDLDMKLFIGGVVQDDEDMADKNEYVRLPAQINDMKRDSFVLHIPEKSLRYGSSEHRTFRIKVGAIATKGVSKLMPSDISKAFWSADIVSPKVSRDVREIVKLAVSQTQKQSHLSKNTNFSRIMTSNNNFDPFNGLYVGAFGPYGTEVVQLRRRFGQWNETNDMSSDMEFVEYVEAVKLTGDLNVPAGQVTFRAKLGKGSRNPNREMYPDEFGVVASYRGQGRIAEFGFRNPEWVDGELLQLNGKGIGPYVNGADLGFLYVIPEQSFLVLFNRLRLPE